MVPVIYAPEAERDLDGITAYIAKDNPKAAEQFGYRLIARADLVAVGNSWKHLLQRERMTKNEKGILLKLRSLRTDPNPPEEWISLSVEKEVLNRRVRTGGLPPDYVDQ